MKRSSNDIDDPKVDAISSNLTPLSQELSSRSSNSNNGNVKESGWKTVLKANIALYDKMAAEILSESALQEVDELESENEEDLPTCNCSVRKPDIKPSDRVDPDAKGVLVLDKTTIPRYLKHFKVHIPNLAEFPGLEPYIIDSASNVAKSKIVEDREIDNSDTRIRGEFELRVFPYPLTKAQLNVLKMIRKARTLVFSVLPSYETTMKLIAISTQVTTPFFDQVLFPNVRNVIFSSHLQERSLEYRHEMTRHPPPCGSLHTFPHPITFALDWLVGNFDLCIHGPSSAYKIKWIDSQVKAYRGDTWGDFIRDDISQQWRDLNPLGGTMAIEQAPGLYSITYHNISPGDRPYVLLNHETFLHFGRHEETNTEDADETLQAIAESLSSWTQEQETKVHFIDLENLLYPSTRKPGPKISKIRLDRRDDTKRKLLKFVWYLCEQDGRKMKLVEKNELAQSMLLGGSEGSSTGECGVCRDVCSEDSCVEDILG